jgi:hypothetical protein
MGSKRERIEERERKKNKGTVGLFKLCEEKNPKGQQARQGKEAKNGMYAR